MSPTIKPQPAFGARQGGLFAAVAVIAVAAGLALWGCRLDGGAAEAAPPPPLDTAAPANIATPPAASSPALPAAPTPTAAPPSPAATATPEPPAPTPSPTVTATARPIRTTSRAQGAVGRIAVARGVDGLQRPVDQTDTFAADERVYVSVEFRGVKSGTVLGITWNRNGEELFTYETPPQSGFSRGYFAFFFDPGGEGEFKADILLDGEVVATAEFAVVA